MPVKISLSLNAPTIRQENHSFVEVRKFSKQICAPNSQKSGKWDNFQVQRTLKGKSCMLHWEHIFAIKKIEQSAHFWLFMLV